MTISVPGQHISEQDLLITLKPFSRILIASGNLQRRIIQNLNLCMLGFNHVINF